MVRNFCLACLCIVFVGNSFSQTLLFDNDWRFHRGGAQGAEATKFDDTKWRRVDLPHDWSIEDLPGTQSPFSRDAISQVSGGFTIGGTGWYRKTFTVPAEQKIKKTIIQFDGIYMNADVYLNGQLLGNHPYGYTSFIYDLSNKINYGEKNIIAVKVKNEGENSRWYSGSGIYRHVWLHTLNSVHIAQWGTSVSTTDQTNEKVIAAIKTKVVNELDQESSVTVVNYILDVNHQQVVRKETNKTIQANATVEIGTDMVIRNPSLWSTDSPYLYSAVTEVKANGIITDRSEIKFGVRTVSFDVKNGFRLNGQTIKLKGGCIHHDNGPLGARAYDRAEERRVEILKAGGYNAIRSAHNPPSPAILDACDRIGMLVIDETFDMWNEGKNPADYHLYFNQNWQRDVESMVLRDRNHPSIILWSIGNEIPERGRPEGVKTAHMMVNFIKNLDSTRAVTAAVNGLNADKDPYFAALDVAGYNYAVGGDHNKSSLHELDHERIPQRIMLGTESYPLEAFGAWMEVVDHPYLVGDFVWTAFDYIGEASIGWRGYYQNQNFYPWNLAFCGDFDICGWKRPQSYYRDALWKQDQISIFVKPPTPSFKENKERESWSKWHWDDVVDSWNWKGYEYKSLQVNVYSSCDEVELFLNAKSLGRKPTNRSTKYMAIFNVPYQAGTLKAIGYSAGKQVNTTKLSTASEPVRMKLTADRSIIKANNQDLSYVTIELLDAEGTRNPTSDPLIHFELAGPGTIVGVGNAHPMSLESYQQPKRKGWHGRCLIIIKANDQEGLITLKAKCSGLPTAYIDIKTE